MRRTTSALAVTAVVGGLMATNPLLAQAADFAAVDIAGLRQAVTDANATPEADTITLTAGTTYALAAGAASEDANASGDLDVLAPLTINGNGATLSAAGLDRFFDVLGGTSLTLVDVTIDGGVAPVTENGGAVRASAGSSLAVTGSTFTGNTAVNPGAAAATAGSGGAIATAGSLTVTGSTFSGNTVTRAGGAIELSAGAAATVSSSTFTTNNAGAAPGNGGGIHLTGAATATVDNSTFRGNTAAEGGALWNSVPGTLTVTGSTIDQNTATGAAADQGGGGVFTEGGAVTISGSDVTGNRASGAAGSGGGIQNINGNVTVTDSTVSGNTAERAGGGIEAGPLLASVTPPVTALAVNTTTTLTNVDLSGNSFTTVGDASPRNGAGLHITGVGIVTVEDSTVSGNVGAREGGGLWNSATGTMVVTDTSISGNVADGAAADQGGGGIFTEGGDVVVTTSDITDNDATGTAGSGGGILNISGSVVVAGSLVSGNTAVRAGGGIEAGPLLTTPAVENGPPAVTGNTDPTTTAVVETELSFNTVTGPPGNGGGLHLTGAGEVLVDTSTVRNNTAVEGGGLWNSATGALTVLNSTLNDNTATGTTAPVGGGAVYNDGGTVTGFNITVTGNEAAAVGGAVLSTGGMVDLAHATVTGNSSGIAVVGGSSEIGNTILTGNDADDATGDVQSLGGNVLDDALPFSTARTAGDEDTTGVTDPQVGELGDNGGATDTRLPAAGSPAIDAGVTIEVTPADTGDAEADAFADELAQFLIDFDQREFGRPVDGDGNGSSLVDSGAVEVGATEEAGDDDDDDNVGGGNGNGNGTPVSPPAKPVTAQPNYTG